MNMVLVPATGTGNGGGGGSTAEIIIGILIVLAAIFIGFMYWQRGRSGS